MNNVVSFTRTERSSCSQCRATNPCLVRALPAELREEIARHVTAGPPIARGDHLFRQGESMQAFYLLRGGSVKSYLDSEDGCEQVAAFHFPGDILGFDGMANRQHMSSAIALETTAYCTVPVEGVMTLAASVPGLWSALMRGAAGRLVEAGQHALLLGQKSAPARLASFLLSLSHRFAARGCSPVEFNLSMSRQDIANYLAVAVETISRLLTELQRRGAITVDRRNIRIRSLSALQAMASESPLARAQHG